MRDRLVRWGRNRAAVASIPTATVVRFENSGHAPFLEEPEPSTLRFARFSTPCGRRRSGPSGNAAEVHGRDPQV